MTPVPPPPPRYVTTSNNVFDEVLAGTIKILKVEEGDIIVIESTSVLSSLEYNQLAVTVKMLLENVGLKDVSVAILDGGIKVGKIIRKSESNKRLPRRMDSDRR